jgi:TolB-like protein
VSDGGSLWNDADNNPVPARDQVISALERIIASSGLAPGSRRALLLRHIVNEALAGRRDRLTGTAIAFDVFGRGADFDPVNDSIVRTEMRRVRHVLNSYFAGQGSEDPIRISLPKGTYVPQFGWAPARASAAADRDAGPLEGAQALMAPAGPAEPGAGVSSGPDPSSSARSRRSRSITATIVVAAATLAVVIASLWWNLRTHGADGVQASMPAVFVMPFQSTGEDPIVGILAEGLTVRLIADLMRYPDFRLYTYDSTILGSEASTIADKADVDYVVVGKVRGDASLVSVVVQLVDMSDNRVLWSDVYSKPTGAGWVSHLEAEISGRIANVIAHPYGVIRTEIAPDFAVVAFEPGIDSFTCVMQAYSYRFTNRSTLYPDVRECLEAAVEQDPDYAEAWAMLAFLRLDGARFGYDDVSGLDIADAFAPARAAAAQALILDPENGQAIMALSTLEFYSGNYDESNRLARQAIDLNPNDPDGLAQLGWRLIVRGNFDEGLPYLEQAIARSVRPPPWYFHSVAVERMMRGDMRGMLAAAERAEADGSSPSAMLLAIAQAGVGQTEAARETVAVMAERWPLLASDPARALAMHHVEDSIVAALIDGLRTAGWRPEEYGG